ncbi:VWA domain-containing protein [Candidatus Woesearchaeota archaeon]|nr:VWA domain-containing protein [Candidatus Woesearchaeota archaeon]
MEIIFDHPYYLVMLASIPLLIVTHFYLLTRIKKKGMKFANFETLKRVSGGNLITKNISLLILRSVIFSLMIIGASGPVFWYMGEESNNDFVLTIDTSASMLAEDLYPDRLRSAKSAAVNFVDSMDTRTSMGVVSFSGISLTETLITSDFSRVKSSIENLDIMTSGGTDIGTALVTSTNMLLGNNKGKSIVLLTDGSQTSGSFIDDPVQFGIDYAKEHHVIVYTIGIGTEQGFAGYIPLNLTAAYDKSALGRISNETGGRFFEAGNETELNQAFGSIAQLKRQAYLDVDLKFGLMMISLLLLFIEWGLINTRFRALP